MKKRDTSGRRLCRLCGKEKEEKEFVVFTLTMLGKKAIRYKGCKSCDVVIHNASILIREAILQETRWPDPGLLVRDKSITPSTTGNKKDGFDCESSEPKGGQDVPRMVGRK
jgi:hypothetical protein